MNDNELRQETKMLKAKGAIKSYREIAELLEITRGSFYNWLNDFYSLSAAKKHRLREIIEDLTIPQ
jgi:DNA invertase Pin-like site-specific DNA recombinase